MANIFPRFSTEPPARLNPQRLEGLLLVWAGFFMTFNQVGLMWVRERAWTDGWVLAVWLVLSLVSVWSLNRAIPQRDPLLLPVAMLLTGWGLNLIDRLLPIYTVRQAAWAVLGVLVMVGISFLPHHLRWLRRYRYLWLTSGLGLLALTIIIGVNPSGFGPRLWLGLGEIFFQPSELLKVLLVVFLASYMADHQAVFHAAHLSGRWHQLPSWQFFTPMITMWGLCLVLLVWQRDLGTATIFFLVFLLMLYLASGQSLLLLGGTGLLLVAASGAYFIFPIVALRVDIWLNPWHDPDNTSFQIVQSLMAVADGGVMGSGIGQGIPNFIPVVHTDFAYAAIAEEWGLVGAIGVMSLILVLVLRGFRLALQLQHKPFQAYLAAGLSILLGVQSLMIVMGTLNLIPLTGVTLPFVSYGGSSLLTNFMVVGLLLVLSGETVPETPA